MPKFNFLTYLPGNFRNHISYEFDILQECVHYLAYKRTKKLGHPIKDGRLAAIFVFFEKFNFLEKNHNIIVPVHKLHTQ